MSEWREYKLGDLTELVTKGTTPTTIGGEFVESGINFIKSESVNYDGRIDKSKFVYIDAKTHEKLKRSQLIENDILFSMAGVFLGKNAIVTKDLLPANTNQALAIIRLNKAKAFSQYIHYYLSQPIIIDFVNNMSGQSAQPNINFEEIKSIDILLPLLPEQRAIASILTSLDDKIDMLHRQNATLEKMAETLFRQWFVEEAKEVWEAGTILNFANHHKTSIHPQKNPTTEYFHYSIPSFDSNKTPIKELGNSIQSNKYTIPGNCILFSKLNPHKDKRIWLLQDDVTENSICSTEFQIILPKKKEYLYFLYGWLSSKENYNEIASGIGGTSGSHQRIDPATIFDFQCPCIDKKDIVQYNNFAEPIFNKIKSNQSQIRTLTQLRDTLLPKLMSGEVKIGN